MQRGNDPHAITKIGDSLSASPLYLMTLHQGDHDLGPYDFLEATIATFGASTQQPSMASKIGLNSYAVFDPLWADKELCEAGESPLDCELRRQRPAVAFVVLGGNDARSIYRVEQYTGQMTLLVERLLEAGTIPVLMEGAGFQPRAGRHRTAVSCAAD